MDLPIFYKQDAGRENENILLDEHSSKHIVQVLRMQNGEHLQLTDGKGNLFIAEITDNNRKNCAVNITRTITHQPPTRSVTIAISLIKNLNRFEWFLEKATEIGVTEIIPLLCSRTEKQNFRFERMQNILISAMLQSQQNWLPVLHEPIKFNEAISKATQQQKFIAHCADENNKAQLVSQLLSSPASKFSKLIFIGPEGDFTKEEIHLALQNDFIPVALGDTRLRTETAGIVAASLLSLV